MFNPAYKEVGVYSGSSTTKGHLSCVVYIDEFIVDDTKTILKESEYRTIDNEIFTEQNKLRADPKSYVDKLKAMLPDFTDKVFKETGKAPITTTEGKAAVEEAIKYLEAASEAPKVPKLRRLDEDPKKDDKEPWKVAPIIGTAALTLEEDMTSACKDHVDDTGPTGVTGLKGTDDSTPEKRIDKYGKETTILA